MSVAEKYTSCRKFIETKSNNQDFKTHLKFGLQKGTANRTSYPFRDLSSLKFYKLVDSMIEVSRQLYEKAKTRQTV